MTDKPNPFHQIDQVSSVRNGEFDENTYIPFMVNRHLSYFTDTVLWANDANHALNGCPKEWQFDFLSSSITKRKRFAKWHKSPKGQTSEIRFLQMVYRVNYRKAKEYRNLLSESDIKKLKGSHGHMWESVSDDPPTTS